MRHLELLQIHICDVTLQLLVLKFRHTSTRGADEVMMRFDVKGFLVLSSIAKRVLDEQLGIKQKHDGVVERGPADPEVFLLQHDAVESLNVKMAINRIDGIEYGKSLGCLAMFIDAKILGKYLLNSIFYIVHV